MFSNEEKRLLKLGLAFLVTVTIPFFAVRAAPIKIEKRVNVKQYRVSAYLQGQTEPYKVIISKKYPKVGISYCSIEGLGQPYVEFINMQVVIEEIKEGN